MKRRQLPTREPTIRNVFPDFSNEQLRDAEDKLRDYLAFVGRMYDRIRADPEAYAKFKTLTAERSSRTINSKGRFLTGLHVSNL